MAPKVAIYDNIPMQNIIFLENGGKQSQTGPIRTRRGQTVPNWNQLGPVNAFI